MKENTYYIGKKEFKFKTNALIPLMFINEFNMDLLVEMQSISEYVFLRRQINENLKEEEEKGKEVEYLSEDILPAHKEILIKLAYLMNRIGEGSKMDFYEWIEKFNVNDIISLQSIAIEMWVEEMATTSVLKKKKEP